MAVASVRAEHHVFVAQMGTHPCGDRLFPDVGVAGAVDFPRCVQLHQLLLRTPDQQHLAIKRQRLFPANCYTGRICHQICPPLPDSRAPIHDHGTAGHER